MFELIKSLNKSEKRYFKLFSSRHTIGEENGYIRLFDFIERMETYQEDLIFMHFKGQALLNKFSITKARLYDNILRSLDSFYATASTDAQLFRLLHAADILYNKGLYKQEEKVLVSAEKKAEKHERLNLLLEIRQKQNRIVENSLYHQIGTDEIKRLFDSEKMVIEEIGKYHELWHTKSLLFHSLNKSGRSNQHAESGTLGSGLGGLIARVSGMNIEKSTTQVRYLYNHIHSAYYFSTGDFESSLEFSEKNLSTLQANNDYVADHPNIYFSLLSNHVYLATKLGRYDEARKTLQALKDHKKATAAEENKDIEIKYFSTETSLELYLLIEQGNYDAALQLVPKIELAYDTFGENISVLRKAYIDFKVAVLFVSVGQPSKALVWINQILNETRIDQNEEIYCLARLLSLVVYYELEKKDVLPYTISSVRRSLKNRKHSFKAESLFIKAMGQIMRSENIFDLEEQMLPIEQEMLSLRNDVPESAVFEYFDFSSWIRSRIEQKPLSEILKRTRSNQVIVA